MPCLNETKTIGDCIQKIHTTCQTLNLKYEVLVSDNGSTDGSQELCRNLGARVAPAVERGYGAALKNGFDHALGDYIIFADADDTYDFREIPKFWTEVQKGHEVVIGTRLNGHIHPGAMPLLHRYLGTPVLTFLIRLFYGIQITDCNSGMRLLKKSVYQRLGMVSSGMEFASEMLIKLGLHRVGISEIPIQLWPDRRGRPPHLKTWRDGWRHLRFILMYAPNQILIRPGLVLLTLGTLMVGGLSFGPIQLLQRFWDYHTQIVGATFGLVGMTMWGFGHLVWHFSEVGLSIPARPTGPFLRWSFERKLVFGGLTILAGAAVLVNLIQQWAELGFQNLSAINGIVLSLYLIVCGVWVVLLSLTLFTFEYKLKK